MQDEAATPEVTEKTPGSGLERKAEEEGDGERTRPEVEEGARPGNEGSQRTRRSRPRGSTKPISYLRRKTTRA